MDILAALMGTLFCLTQLTGCTVGEIGEPYNDRSRFGVIAPYENGVHFELPSEWKEVEGDYIMQPPPSHVSLPKRHDFLEWEVASATYGDEAYARQMMREELEEAEKISGPDNVVYSEKEVVGYKLYVLEILHDYEIVDGSENPPLGYYWTTFVLFYKGGKVHNFTIYGDRFDNHIKAVEMFMKTFRS